MLILNKRYYYKRRKTRSREGIPMESPYKSGLAKREERWGLKLPDQGNQI